MARMIDADRMKEELLWGNVFLSAKETNALVDLIDNQPTLTPPNEWVSVEERLPEPTYCVLVYTTDYSIEVDARGSDGEWMSHEVTHWMPLPAPPDSQSPERQKDNINGD